jgi:hypothetical protein
VDGAFDVKVLAGAASSSGPITFGSVALTVVAVPALAATELLAAAPLAVSPATAIAVALTNRIRLLDIPPPHLW